MKSAVCEVGRHKDCPPPEARAFPCDCSHHDDERASHRKSRKGGRGGMAEFRIVTVPPRKKPPAREYHATVDAETDRDEEEDRAS